LDVDTPQELLLALRTRSSDDGFRLFAHPATEHENTRPGALCESADADFFEVWILVARAEGLLDPENG
jgi:hypothetical protein